MSAFDSQRISTLPLSVHICLVATREVLIRTPNTRRKKGGSHEYVPRGACRSRTCAIRADTHLRVDSANACSAALFSCQAPWLEQIRARHEQDYQPPDNWQGCL